MTSPARQQARRKRKPKTKLKLLKCVIQPAPVEVGPADWPDTPGKYVKLVETFMVQPVFVDVGGEDLAEHVAGAVPVPKTELASFLDSLNQRLPELEEQLTAAGNGALDNGG